MKTDGLPAVNTISILLPHSSLVSQGLRAHQSVGIYLLPVLTASGRALRGGRVAFIPRWSAPVIDSAISAEAHACELV